MGSSIASAHLIAQRRSNCACKGQRPFQRSPIRISTLKCNDHRAASAPTSHKASASLSSTSASPSAPRYLATCRSRRLYSARVAVSTPHTRKLPCASATSASLASPRPCFRAHLSRRGESERLGRRQSVRPPRWQRGAFARARRAASRAAAARRRPRRAAAERRLRPRQRCRTLDHTKRGLERRPRLPSRQVYR